MAVDRVHSSYILRLTQRLSRLTFELRDVRSGQVRQFESARELSSYLEAALEAQDGLLSPPARAEQG